MSSTTHLTPSRARPRKHRIPGMEYKIAVVTSSIWAIISVVTHFCAMLAAKKGESNIHLNIFAHAWFLCTSLSMVPYLALIWTSYRRDATDIGPELVRVYPTIPMILRPIISLWWFILFMETFTLSLLLEGVINDPQSQLPPNMWAVQYFVAFCINYAGNGYMLLALGTITKNERFWGPMWRKRFVMDVFLTSLGFFSRFL